MFLVVGLGNPGSEYVGTRHNVGWDVVDSLAAKLGWIDSKRRFNRLARDKFNALTMDGPLGSEKVLLLKPTTYMNLSGQAVRQALDFYRLEPGQLMVVLDDLALPCGKIRIRAGGSHGGHNGLRDIERALGTRQYPRLRLGIDAPPPPMAGRDYVLGAFTAEQLRQIEPAVDRAGQAIVKWMQNGIDSAMNEFNQADEKPAAGE
ncbi:MAG TPA: aminoacyl-tRNA hydrolase [Tepidisphaeraceae bacterium]|nr:aminoacyl-tRNA hydrolase [Tepidisphaeraceae bacterium]